VSETELPLNSPDAITPNPEADTNRLILLGLIVLVLACFWPLGHADFINYDDPTFVTFNPYIRQGITLDTIKYSFVSFDSGYWHPLTWLSHALDVNIYGPKVGDTGVYFPAGHHFTNLLLHMASTLLVWVVLKRMTGRNLASAWVAAMFAVHPMHVESVAWISERKSVLSTFFFLLTLLAYHRYTLQRTADRYLLVVLAFACALMSKPFTVTTPCVLLLLDVWPLKRIELGPAFWRTLGRSLVDKIPLLLLAAGSSFITIYSTVVVKTFYYFDQVPLRQRLATSIISYARYLGKLVWPTHLSVFYPFPAAWPMSWIAGSTVLFILLTVLATLQVKKRPYLLIGWLWFAGMLVPVIGLFAVGDSSLDDRYTYVPYLGLFIAIAWFALDLPESFKKPLAGLGIALVLICAVLSYKQTWVWQDTTTVMGHAMSVTEDNWLADLNYGISLIGTPREAEAETYFKDAIRIRPTGAAPRVAYAKFLLDNKRLDEALPHIYVAGKIKPDAWNFQTLYARALAMNGRHQEAIDRFQSILQEHPQVVEAEVYMARSLVALGRLDDAEQHYRNALKYDPSIARAHHELGAIAAAMERPQDALEEFEGAIAINPGLGVAHLDYAVMLAKIGKYEESMAELGAADKFLGPTELHERSLMEMTMGTLLEKMRHPVDASGHYVKALDLAREQVAARPNEPAAHYELAITLKRLGTPEEAAQVAQKAMDLAFSTGNRYFVLALKQQFPEVKFVLPTTRPTTNPTSQPTTKAVAVQ